jgi:hypothetical protein
MPRGKPLTNSERQAKWRLANTQSVVCGLPELLSRVPT